MPRYFFHAHDGYIGRDTDGTELSDIHAARHQAIRASGEILRDMGAQFWNGTEWELEVTDEHGRILFILRFSAEERLDLPETRPSSSAS